MSLTLLSDLPTCRRCPRLVALAETVAQTYPSYHAAPVGAWGDKRARLMIVGLAPGLHGAARTGKAFVGDASGTFLFAALQRTGFASSRDPSCAKLRNARITNVVKCLPPGNAPTATEVNTCRDYLNAELAHFAPPAARQPRVIVSLGGVAHKAVCRTLGITGTQFAHGQAHLVHEKLTIISSFHPSRLNVNTGRINAQMIDEVFNQATALIEINS